MACSLSSREACNARGAGGHCEIGLFENAEYTDTSDLLSCSADFVGLA